MNVTSRKSAAVDDCIHGFPKVQRRLVMCFIVKWHFHVLFIVLLFLFDIRVINSECGRSLVDQSNFRIVGGRTAEEKEFPWHAVLYRVDRRDNEKEYQCGAAILNERWVLTAAHCVHRDGRRAAQFLRLGVGSIDLEKVQLYDIRKTYRHKRYNPSTYENDIALVKTVKPIMLSMESNVNSICLPDINTDVLGKATVSGFGLNHLRSENVEELMSVEIEVYNRTYCSKLYKSKLKVGMICGGSPKGGRDSCQGDSGGPLIKRDTNGRAMIIGIVSWGIGCGRKEYPGVYVDVKRYKNWINRITKPKKSTPIPVPEKIVKPEPVLQTTVAPVRQTMQTLNDTFNEECVLEHNKFRSKHKSPLLTTDFKLIEAAKQYATMATNNYYEFMRNNKYGQNIARYYGSDPRCKDVVQFWYSDSVNYDYSNPRYSPQSGTFTQLVWKSSTKLGCAKKAGQSGSTAVICLYDPSGNVHGQFASNVSPS